MKKITGRRRASIVLKDIQGLAHWRRSQGLVLSTYDRHQFARMMAMVLVGMTPTYEERSRIHGHLDSYTHGLDFHTLSRAIEEAGFDLPSEVETMTIIHDVMDYHERYPNRPPVSNETIGKALGLLAVERKEARCWNILPIDQTKQEREAARRARKQQRDRQNAEAKRRAEGRGTRPEYLALANERRAFCETHGITRQTLSKWLRAGRARIENGKVTSVSPTDISSNRRATHLETLGDPPSAPMAGPASPGNNRQTVGAGVASPHWAASQQSSGPSVEASPAGVGYWLQRLNETDSAYHGRSARLPAEAA